MDEPGFDETQLLRIKVKGGLGYVLRFDQKQEADMEFDGTIFVANEQGS